MGKSDSRTCPECGGMSGAAMVGRRVTVQPDHARGWTLDRPMEAPATVTMQYIVDSKLTKEPFVPQEVVGGSVPPVQGRILRVWPDDGNEDSDDG